MSLHRRLLAASLILALSACADMGHIAPQSAMLDASKLQANQAMDAAASAAIEWPRTQWWQDLHDPQLNRLMDQALACLLYTSPSPRDLSTSRMPSSA